MIRDAFLPQFTNETINGSANDSCGNFERKIKELVNKYIPSKLISSKKKHQAMDH
jgi:hypothetical protein